MNRIATAMLAAVVAATPVLATATAASADYRGPNNKHGKRVYAPRYDSAPNWAGVGAGFVAGAAVGVGAGLLINRPPPPPRAYYYAPPPPPPVVYYPAPAPAYYPPPPAPVYYDRGWTEAHIEWCLDRYRSYNPATNTFTGYDGYQHVCRGPY